MLPASHNLSKFYDGEFGRPLVKLRSGAHLYGTAHAGSDTDIRGVFIPRPSMIVTGRFPKSVVTKPNKEGEKNSPDSCDESWASLHHFLDCALRGETNALDWLHADLESENIYFSTDVWKDLVSKKREFFYSRFIGGLVGYAQHQAAKYGIRGSRIAVMERVLEFLRSMGDVKLEEVWDSLPTGEHIQFVTTANGESGYRVCGKILLSLSKASHYIHTFQRALDEYGDRAKKAKENKGVDWKALSHALRAGYQFKRLLIEGTYYFPLPEAAYLLSVKRGERDFTSDVQPTLENLIDEVFALAEKSNLPEKPNSEAAYKWLSNVCRSEIVDNW